MWSRPKLLWGALLTVTLAVAACRQSPDPASVPEPAPEANRPRVFAMAYPTLWLAETIGGDAVRAVDVRPEHDDPALWSPSQENIFTIQEAATVVLVGGDFEPWYRPKDFAPFSVFKLVDPLGAAAIERPGGGAIPQVWFEPEALDLVGRGLADHLAASMPSEAEGFRARQAALSKRLAALDEELKKQLSGVPKLFAAQVGYEYLARSFGWDLQVLAVDPAAVPSAEEIERWKTRRRGHDARFVLFPSAAPEAVEAGLRSAGLEPVVFEWLTHRSAEDVAAGRDYFDLMRRNASNLAAAVAGPPG